MIYLYLIWAAIIWRIRGGGWETWLKLPPTTQGARLFAGFALSTPLAFMTGDLWLCLLTLTIPAGLMMMGWGGFFDIARGGRNREVMSYVMDLLPLRSTSRWHDAIGMSLTVAAMWVPTALALWYLSYGFMPVLIAALMAGPLYAFNWWVAERIGGHATDNAELCMGATLAAGLICSIY